MYSSRQNTRIKTTEQFFDSIQKCAHSEKNLSQASINYGILYEE